MTGPALSEELCYLCRNPLPTGQSYYEDHAAKVCLECFRTTPRCRKCKFPSKQLQMYPGFGEVCEFCQKGLEQSTGLACYHCGNVITAWMSHYADHGKAVCQDCFKDIKVRCFLCRFPSNAEEVQGLGGVCEFCQEDVVRKGTKLDQLIPALQGFLNKFGHQLEALPTIEWVDWKVILGMQVKKKPKYKINFLDELLHYCYPLVYLNGRFYAIPVMSRRLFVPHYAIQAAAADLCQRHKLPHLFGDSPFHQLARGWVHYLGITMAGMLKYDEVKKQLGRSPEGFAWGDFPRFQAMMEYRNPHEIITYGQTNLKQRAEKFL